MVIDQDEARRCVTDAVLAILASDKNDPLFVEKLVNRLIGATDPAPGTTGKDRARNHWVLLTQTLFTASFMAELAAGMSSRETVTNKLIDYREAA